MASTIRVSAPPASAVQRYFEISLYLLVCTGVMAVLTTSKLDPVSTIVPAVALGYKALRLWRGRGPEISARVATGLVLAYFLFFPFDLWVFSRNLAQDAPNSSLYSALLAAIHLLLFATLVRLYSARTNRDYMFLAVLAFTSILAAAILTVETSFLVSLAVFLVLAVSTFVALEIRRSAAGAVSPPLEPGTALAHRLNRALGLTSLMVAAGALAIGGLLFFLLPRFTTGYLSAMNVQPTLMTGFSDNVTLGEIGLIKQSPQVVMRIRVEGDPARASEIHWRGLALTDFDGKRWFTPPHEPTQISPDSDGEYQFAQPQLAPGEYYPLHYIVLMEPIGTDAIFVAPRLETIRGHFSNETERPGSRRQSSYLLLDRSDAILNPFHNAMKVRYEATSFLPMLPPAVLRKASRDFPGMIRGIYLQLPPSLDPRITKLAEQITAGSHNDYDRAANIERYLKTQYGYTLDLSGPPVDDPLANFLFVRRAGHCEYFASAMAIMLRTLQIPSRYVTGFLPGEFNDVGGDYIIRGSDAHSWVEAYFPGHGWITFDPTPSGEAKHGGLLGRLGLYWDWFQFAWSEWIVNYDFTHQIVLAQNLQKSSHDYGARARAYYERKRTEAMALILALDRRIEASPYFLPALLFLLIALLVYLRGRSLIGYFVARLALRARRGGIAAASLASLEYREMLRLLEKRGWKKAESQTALEFAAGIPAGELAVPVAEFTELYQTARFGGQTAPVNRMSALLGAIRELIHGRKS
jgi:protein-glutamine gamma-glutamyltransferase